MDLTTELHPEHADDKILIADSEDQLQLELYQLTAYHYVWEYEQLKQKRQYQYVILQFERR